MLEGFILLETVFDEAGEPVDYRFLYVNPAFEALVGKEAGQMVGRTKREIFPYAEPYWYEIYGGIVTTGKAAHFERYLPTLKKHLEISAYSPGKGQVAAIFLDVTVRKQMEEELHAARQFQDLLLDSIPQIIYVLNTEGRYCLVNRSWEKASNIKREEAIGRSPYQTVSREIARHCLTLVRQVIETGEGITDEVTSEINGSPHTFRTTRFPLRRADGSVHAVGNITEDITFQKQAERRLQESEAVLRSFFDSPGQLRGIVEIRDNDVWNISINESAAKFAGGTKEEMCGKSARQIGVPAGEVEMWIRSYEESRTTGQPVRFEFHHESPGKEAWFVARVSYIGEHHGQHRYAYVITDIAERKKAEAERDRLVGELQQALGEVKTLSGLLPICSSCKKIRDDSGSWLEVESYIQHRSDAHFSHGICPDCVKKLYSNILELP